MRWVDGRYNKCNEKTKERDYFGDRLVDGNIRSSGSQQVPAAADVNADESVSSIKCRVLLHRLIIHQLLKKNFTYELRLRRLQQDFGVEL